MISGPPAPPAAPASGDPDPYAWMRDRDLPAMRDYLAAERAWYDRWLESARGLRDELAAELTARMIPAEDSVSWRRGGHSNFTRTVPGRDYEQFCRTERGGRPAQVLLDENLLLAEDPARGGYLGLGVRYRPHEVWRHVLGTGPDRDALVFREEDQRFDLTVRATRSGAYVLIETESRDSTGTLVLPAAGTDAEPAVMEKRRPGIEYRAEHADGPGPGEFFLVTNADAASDRT